MLANQNVSVHNTTMWLFKTIYNKRALYKIFKYNINIYIFAKAFDTVPHQRLLVNIHTIYIYTIYIQYLPGWTNHEKSIHEPGQTYSRI